MIIPSTENVARAIFSPMMIDERGHILRPAFMLRHNEDYISVCRMAVDSWMDDVKSIPQNPLRVLYGYAKMNVGEIRQLSFANGRRRVDLDVVDKHTAKNASHAGIVLTLDGNVLRGDKKAFLKPVTSDVSVEAVILRYQRKLAELAQRGYVQTTAL